MKRIGRIILNALTVLSLLLSVASIALWVQSRWKPGGGYRHREWRVMTPHGFDVHHTTYGLLSGRDGLFVSRTDGLDAAFSSLRLNDDERPHWGWDAMWSTPGRNFQLRYQWRLKWLGLYVGHEDENAVAVGGAYNGAVIWRQRRRVVGGAHWLAAALFATLPLVRLLRRRRPKPGHCPACDYDLTGNVGGVCPECGLTVDRSGLTPEPAPIPQPRSGERM